MAKPVTLKMVANKADVSYLTVSKVINNKATVSPETEKRVKDAVREELGYTPNHTDKSLRLQRPKTIGYSCEPSPPDQTSPILDEFLQNRFRMAEVYGYFLLYFPFHHEEQKQVETYRSLFDAGRVDGFILFRVNYDDPCVNYLLENKVPFMAIGAMKAIRNKGLESGRDIAVTGFDDTPTARFLNPPLTTLR